MLGQEAWLSETDCALQAHWEFWRKRGGRAYWISRKPWRGYDKRVSVCTRIWCNPCCVNTSECRLLKRGRIECARNFKVRLLSNSGRLALVLMTVAGLYLQAADLQVPPLSLPPDSPKLTPLLVDGAGRAITDREAWTVQRRTLEQVWRKFLGPYPERKAELKTKVLVTEDLPQFTRRHVTYQVEEGVLTDAYLLVPHGASGRLPGLVVFHPTVANHMEQVAGVDLSKPDYLQGVRFAQRGYVVLCPRCYIFGDGTNYEGHVRQMQAHHADWTGMARMTWDAIRAVDFLQAQPEVDSNRIGGFGHSLGAKEVLYAAAFDPRYRAVVFSEGGIGLGFSNWDADWYLGPAIKRPDFKLEHHQLLGLIAPRAFLLLAGDSADGDRSWPFIAAARPVYALLAAPGNIGWLNHHLGHPYRESVESVAADFLERHLAP